MNSFIISFDSLRMRPQTYVAAVIAMALTWLAATMAANVLIDPQGVFGTNLLAHRNANGRYLAVKAYEAAPDRYDAVLFASSRGGVFDRSLLAKLLNARDVADFAVPFGLLSDYLPILQFLLRDKAGRRTRLKAVFVVLDADFFGLPPWTNINIDGFLPPEVSGEAPFRFWWRYLTAFQFKEWREDIRGALASEASIAPKTALAGLAGFISTPSPATAAAKLSPIAPASIREMEVPQIRSDLAHQIALLCISSPCAAKTMCG